MINPVDFWPQYFTPATAAHWAHFVYPAVGDLPGYSSTFFYDPATKAMKLAQYDLSNNWMSNWYLQNTQDGLFEVKDEIPQTNSFLKSVFGPIATETYSTPIGWGANGQIVGSSYPYDNRPAFSGLGCKPPQFGSGLQVVVFEGFFEEWTDPLGRTWSNVLQMFYQQSWSGGASEGARWMMPKGIGPVASQWVDGTTAMPWQYATYTTA